MNHDHDEQEKRLKPENLDKVIDNINKAFTRDDPFMKESGLVKECELCGENYVGSTFDTCPHCNDELEVECEAFPESE